MGLKLLSFAGAAGIEGIQGGEGPPECQAVPDNLVSINSDAVPDPGPLSVIMYGGFDGKAVANNILRVILGASLAKRSVHRLKRILSSKTGGQVGLLLLATAHDARIPKPLVPIVLCTRRATAGGGNRAAGGKWQDCRSAASATVCSRGGHLLAFCRRHCALLSAPLTAMSGRKLNDGVLAQPRRYLWS